ncbi:MAG: hypothetical protein ACE5I7_06515 [Candidatus Binatia bacterium]
MNRSLAVVLVVLLSSVVARQGVAWCIGGAPPPGAPADLLKVLDPDGDGLNNLQEALFGTDPNRADTDGDGILDGDEQAAGVRNVDRPSLFSVERFGDPRRADSQVLVLEGTNLFSGGDRIRNLLRKLRPSRRSVVIVEETRRRIRARENRRGNTQARIVVRLPPPRAERFLGELPAHVFVRTRNGRTNSMPIMPMDLHCSPPELMAAALITLRTELDGVKHQLNYIGIGGCGLIDATSGAQVKTTVDLMDRQNPGPAEYSICLSGPRRGAALIGSRILTPVRPGIKVDKLNPLPAGTDEVSVGDKLTVRTAGGTGIDVVTGDSFVTVGPRVADLTIPESNLYDDHDGDGLVSADELRIGTDPLMFDTDRDGLPDGLELRRGTDPLDPDTNDDGIPDGVRFGFSPCKPAQVGPQTPVPAVPPRDAGRLFGTLFN